MTPNEIGLWADLLKGAGAGGVLVLLLLYLVISREKKSDKRSEETTRAIDDLTLSITVLVCGLEFIPKGIQNQAAEIGEHVKARTARNKKDE